MNSRQSTLFLTIVQVSIKAISALAITKMITVYCGLDSYVKYGDLVNYYSLISILSFFSIQTAVTRNLSANKYNEVELISNAIFIALITLFLIVFFALSFIEENLWDLILIIFAGYISGINLIYLGLLNGNCMYKKYNLSIIFGSFSQLIFTLIAINFINEMSYIYGLIAGQLISLFFSFKKMKIDYKFVNITIILSLMSYGFVSLSSGFLQASLQLKIRDLLVLNDVLMAAGWDSVIRISILVNILILTPASIILLPKLSKSPSLSALFKYGKVILIALILMNLFIYLTSEYVLQILYNKEISVFGSELSLVILGESFKIMGGFISILFWAVNKVRYYLLGEMVFTSAFFLGLFFLDADLKACVNIYIASSILYVISQFLFLLLIKSEIYSTSP